ncbi:Protein GIGAS CELL1 [Senna tora]|uniref:Protein GIGAS CELL1 n=1 Tax=Senna tora TaxID=362788 RepID=A0A834SIJ0_9FABA|nr:Protein GIGAS CELL1 [Senna tora]
MSRRGVLGYQEGSKLCDGRFLSCRAVLDGIGVPKLPPTTPRARVRSIPVAPTAAVTLLGVDPNKPDPTSSCKTSIIPDRRRLVNTAATSRGFARLSRDSGIARVDTKTTFRFLADAGESKKGNVRGRKESGSYLGNERERLDMQVGVACFHASKSSCWES